MNQPTVSSPNDYKVVEFHNPHDFTFTPEMGCMYNGNPIFGITGAPGINGGESITLPYHVGKLLARNLAKYAMIKDSPDEPTKDAQGNPMIKAIWDSAKLEKMQTSYLKELYSEQKPIAMSETDRLMAKVEEYRKVAEALLLKDEATKRDNDGKVSEPETPSAPGTFLDKAEVIAELEKRGITHDKRKSKAELEKLLA